jgi:transglutaminase-like putative cysteine protease
MYSFKSELHSFADYKSKYNFTVNKMRDLISAGAWNPIVRHTALKIIRNVPERDHNAEYHALHAFVRDKIRFVRDTYNKELLQTPEITLSMAAGDCDDKTTLLCALLLAIGLPAAFATIKTGGQYFSHVYAMVNDNGKWIPLETVRNVPAGIEAEYSERVIYVLA